MQEKAKSGISSYSLPVSLLDFRDDGKYELQCPEGHEYILLVQGTKYEILFEISLNAYFDGYYREAISSFSASLERFYEFFLKALFHFASKEHLFHSSWKKINSSSERQLGAYVFCHAIHFNSEARVLSRKFVELRNNVVHKGYIPHSGEVLEFGQEVCDTIVAGLDNIYGLYGDEFRDFYYAQMPKNETFAKPVVRYAMVGIGWEDIKSKDSEIRFIKKSLERMFGVVVE